MKPARLRRWKEKRRLSDRAVGVELGLSRITINEYLRGLRPIPLTVAKLCWALDCMDILQHRLNRAYLRLERLEQAEALRELARVGSELTREAAE